MFGIDDALADVVTSSTQPALGAIRLAWWREALERLDAGPPPPEPRLRAAAGELLPRGVSGAMLAGLEDGWATLLDEQPDMARVGERGVKLFAMAAELLGAADPLLPAAGRLHGFGTALRTGLIAPYRPMEEMHQLHLHRFAHRLRPLTGLARLAARDATQQPNREAEATPGRAAALLSHRLFGRVT